MIGVHSIGERALAALLAETMPEDWSLEAAVGVGSEGGSAAPPGLEHGRRGPGPLRGNRALSRRGGKAEGLPHPCEVPSPQRHPRPREKESEGERGW